MPCDVLLVEDDADFRGVMSGALADLGFAVRTAEHGLQALRSMRDTRPKVVLLDLMMPVMSGWQFLETVTQSRDIGNIPVIVMTGSSSPRPQGCYKFIR